MARITLSIGGRVLAVIACCLLCVSCGSESHEGFQQTDDYVGYEENPSESVVLTGESDYVGPSSGISPGSDIPIDGEAPVTVDTTGVKFCDDPNAKMDVIVVDGEVVDVICYPPPTDDNMTRIDPAQQGDTDVPQNANNTVIVFDPATDGQVIEGDINVDGNNVAIYGNGAENTVIEGDLIISGNNARVRGLYIKGNVIMDLNNIALLFCVVEGNVEIRKNNVTVAATDIYGDLIVLQNNAILVRNRVQGAWEIGGENHYCDGNTAFEDGNGDYLIDPAEEGEALACE